MNNGAPNNKRKRSTTTTTTQKKGAQKQILVVELHDSDDDEPAVKRVPGPSPSCSRTTRSSSGNVQDKDHCFLVPSTFAPPPPAKKRGVAATGKENNKKGVVLSSPQAVAVRLTSLPTPEQIKHTSNYRKMRKAVIGVIKDVHIEIERRGTPVISSVKDLIPNLWACWKKYPLMFGSSSKVPKVGGDEDLSGQDEIQEFMRWWLHGLSSLVLYQEMAPYSKEVVTMLQTFGQMINYGNPDMVEICFAEIVRVISSLSLSSDDQMRADANVTLQYEVEDENQTINNNVSPGTEGSSSMMLLYQKEPANLKEIVIRYKLSVDDDNDINSNQDGVENLLNILRAFLPRVFYSKVIQRDHLLQVWVQLWQKFSIRRKFKMLKTFLVPELAFIPSISSPSESSLVELMNNVFMDGIALHDAHSFYHFQNLCGVLSSKGVCWTAFPQSVIVQTHSAISSIISSDRFDALPFDDFRSTLIQVYSGLTAESLKDGLGKMLSDKDAEAFQRAAKTLHSLKALHPILENAILEELKHVWDGHVSRDKEVKWELHTPGRKDVVSVVLDQECSQIWRKLPFPELGSQQHNVRNYQTDAKPALKQMCFLIQLASRVHRRFLNYATDCNQGLNLVFKPELCFLTNGMMTTWIELAVKIILHFFSSTPIMRMSDVDEALTLILDTIRVFQDGNWLMLNLSISWKCQLLRIAGLPWLHKFSFPNNYTPSNFFIQKENIQPSEIEKFRCSTLSKCLSTMCSTMFIPFKNLVVDILQSEMDSVNSVEIANDVLILIQDESWAIRSLSWSYIASFLHRIQFQFDWKSDSKFRNNLATAIVKLPCFYTNQELRAPLLQKMKKNRVQQLPEDRKRHIHLLKHPCPFCNDGKIGTFLKANIFMTEKEEDPNDGGIVPIPESELLLVLKIALPLMRSRFQVAKIILCKLITCARNHNKEYVPQLITEFVTTAAQSNSCVGSEIMRHFGFYFKKEAGAPVLAPQEECPGSDFRSTGIDLMINTLIYFLQRSFEDHASIRFSTKILLILKELAKHADHTLVIEILRISLRLIMHRDSNVRNLLSQALCVELSNKCAPICTPWELMISLRYELAGNIVELIVEEFASFSEHSEELQNERVKAFLHGISIMGDFRMHAIFIHHYVPVLLGEIVPYLCTDKRYNFVLQCISEFASATPAQLLQDGFHVYMRGLVLDFSHERATLFLTFLKNTYGLDPVFLATNATQFTVNEMLSYLNERKDKILKFLPCLPQKRNDKFVIASVTSSRSEIQALLNNYLMGFFVFVDTKLHSRMESLSRKKRILESFTCMIELMGKSRITSNRTKVYATLNSLFCLGPNFAHLLLDSWKVFATCLEDTALGQMSAPILSAVSTLYQYLPQHVDSLISYFIHTKKHLTSQFYPELYFVTDFSKDMKVISPIQECIDDIASESWVKFFELLVRESFNENSHIRMRAICKLQSILCTEHDNVKNLILDCEHPVVSQLLSSFLNAARDADRSTLMRLAESFGFLGAVDPYRFKNAQDEEMRRKSMPVLTVDGPAFAAKYLDILVREFQESDDTTDFDYCACLIQSLLQHFQVKKDDMDVVWRTLSPASRELVEPLLVSKYKVDKMLPKVNMSCPIYLSEHGKTFDQWLSNWLSALIGAVKEGTRAFELFQFSKYLVSRNNRVASFLLPYVATYAVINGDMKQKLELVMEIETILQKWIDQDKLKTSSQHILPVKESQADVGTPDPEPKVLYDEDVIQYRCTREVFSVLDHLFLAVRQAKRQAGLNRANVAAQKSRSASCKSSTGGVIPPDRGNPCLTEDQAEIIGELLSKVPMNTVSQVAFHCEDYKRALLYIEQDLKHHPHPRRLQDRLNYVQQIHVSLDDMDSVIGVVAVRQREATMGEIVSESFARGKVEGGIRHLELMVYEDPKDLIATEGLLQAYLSLDEPRKAETLIKGCVSRNPHWEIALEDFQIEATWKLRDWKKLRQELGTISVLSSSSSNPSSQQFQLSLPSSPTSSPLTKELNTTTWSMTVVKILSYIQSLELDLAMLLVNEGRLKLMNPLVAAANDFNAYSRGYSNVVQLHILTEVEQAINLLQRRGKQGFNLRGELKQLINRWEDRGNLLLRSQTYVDPVLNVRKSILEILKDFWRGQSVDLFNGSIRDCWLTAARVESKAGNFTRAFNCIVESKKYNSAQVMIAHAKLCWRKGDNETALQLLQTSIPTFFPDVEKWKENRKRILDFSPLPETSMELENRKLCSQSILLSAILSDELQLLDIEKNVANYESSINIFENSEKNYFTLAGYYDRLFNCPETKSVLSNKEEKVVKMYAKSLHYGCKYVYQSLPRLLSMWFDFAAIGFDESVGKKDGSENSSKKDGSENSSKKGGSENSSKKGSSENSSKSSPNPDEPRPVGWELTVENMQTTIRTLLKDVPAYVLLTAFSQLISRMCHPNPIVWELLRDVIATITVAHPHQALWMTMVVLKSSVPQRRTRCMEIYKQVDAKKPTLKRMVSDYAVLSDRFLELCAKEVPTTTIKSTVDAISPRLSRFLQSEGFSEVLMPYQVFTSPSIPPNGCGHKSYDAFPQKFVFIKGILQPVDIMSSVARPKKIALRGSDGKSYPLLCKPDDDLRKDFKVMEVNNVVNWYLHRNPESRRRQLHVRIYAVTPLNERHGLLEWVPNLTGFRINVISLYRERGNPVIMKNLKGIIKDRDSLEVKRSKFLTMFLQPYPPIFSEWFLNHFNDPQSWYKARLSYVRTAAVMSIVGFVLGLGDRHGENISIDSSNGEIVHVDFNCIFNRGETFQTPERVPFRLTQNMVEAMGPLGVEGVFRRSCEISMNLFRQHKDIFMSVLRPFVFDPCVEWGDSGGSDGKSKITTSSFDARYSKAQALLHLKNIENRINGSARNFTKDVNTELSVEAQVAYLIDEAKSIDNLCQMFVGWTAWI